MTNLTFPVIQSSMWQALTVDLISKYDILYAGLKLWHRIAVSNREQLLSGSDANDIRLGVDTVLLTDPIFPNFATRFAGCKIYVVFVDTIII